MGAGEPARGRKEAIWRVQTPAVGVVCQPLSKDVCV